ncbi:chitin-binding protein [Saccharothrix coeruleofusca]|uniref:lytic polysaccharide monooxygenase n=1 Tax=Saccharothrix coeruleofusca TaxID=33919 RepID=UPI001AE4FC6A|nr:lytic polysaccharide monooxygenase [Saccharothrix coeruleofusca]MBP2335332.1 chitin-binding protein [Saccharothrix coeruleofusca]
MRLKRLGALAAAVLGVVGVTTVFGHGGVAMAHGSMTYPASRTYACYEDGRAGGGGDLNPTNPACVAAVAIGGKQPLWDWYGNLISQAAGKHREIIADGDLCGPSTKYDAYNLARDDWPTTTLRAGAPITFRYNAWAPHPGTWDQYVTKDGFDVTKPLKWSDLEPAPFNSVLNPPLGSGEYSWNATLPNKTGRHIIYSIWQRTDSPEAFYSCSDVIFTGGSGGDGQAPTAPGAPTGTASADSVALSWSPSADNVGVTGYQVFREAGATDVQVASGSTTSATITGLTPSTTYQFYVVARDAAGNTSPPSAAVSVTTAGGGGTAGECAVSYATPSVWSGGFTANVLVKNTGSSAVKAWQLSWELPSGEGIAGSAWSADVAVVGGRATAKGMAWNADIAPGSSVSFGFNGTTGGNPAKPASFTLNGALCASA